MVKIWNKIKNESDLQLQVDLLLKKWNSICLKKKGSLLGFWSKQLSTTAQKQNAAEYKFGDSSKKINPTTEHIPLEFTSESDHSSDQASEIRQLLGILAQHILL